MRKHSSFAIAATIVVLATIFWVTSGPTQADRTGSISSSSSPTIQSLAPVW